MHCTVFFFLIIVVPTRLSRSSNRNSPESVGHSMSPDPLASTEKMRLYLETPPVTADAAEKMDDDISAIMRGATNLKNTRMQLEEQVCLLFVFVSYHPSFACIALSDYYSGLSTRGCERRE